MREDGWHENPSNLTGNSIKWLPKICAMYNTNCLFPECLNEHRGQKENYGRPFVSNQKFMRRICKTAGVKHFGFHATRHLSSSILHKLGYGVRDIQPILRHKSPRTTELYLQRLGLEDVRKTPENLPISSKKTEVMAFNEMLGTGKSGV